MSAHRLRFFEALPAYLGGKRRIVAGAFKHLPGPEAAPVLADVFLGGGAVSLWCKARGYRVACNDLAYRSVIVGRALIENDRVQLTHEDVVRLFVPEESNRRFAEEHLCPDVVTLRHGRFLDNALAAAEAAPEPKRSLLLLLCVRYLYGQRPMGNFGAKSVVHQAEAGDWDAMNPAFVRDMLRRGVVAHPSVLCERLRVSINRGVFAGAGPCSASQMDAADFLAGVEADIAFLDPPYPHTSDYGKALKPVDELLEGKRLNPMPSPFSGAGWQGAMDRLLEAGRHVPTWAITFGNAGGKGASLDDLTTVVRRHRPVTFASATNYIHCTGLSSSEARSKNEEHLVIATKE